MVKITPKIQLITLIISLLVISCRQEEYKYIGTEPQQGLQTNSTIANLLSRTTMYDGSADNILDNASCLAVQLPVTTIVNNTEFIVQSEENFLLLEDMLDNDEEEGELQLVFPITIMLSDYTEIEINSQEELDEYAAECNGENEYDDDIECLDIQYPISLSVFNSISENMSTVTISNDKQMYAFIMNMDENEMVSIDFPISFITQNGVSIEVQNLDELEATIESYEDSCDEDDNNDYNDDDCLDCTVNELQELFLECTQWSVQKLKLDTDNIKDLFDDYSFNFREDFTVIANNDDEQYYGSWEASEAGNLITFEINFPSLPELNAIWIVEEIKHLDDKKELRLYIDKDNTLRFRSDCDDDDEEEDDSIELDLADILTEGDWLISSYIVDGSDYTSYYTEYVYNFNEDGSLDATNLSLVKGSWNLESNNTVLNIHFSLLNVLDLMSYQWQIVAATETHIELQYISPVDGELTTLTLTKD